MPMDVVLHSPSNRRKLRAPPIVGVFDSGIGGLSILRELRAQLPSAAMHYVADSGYAPYGERGDNYVAERSLRIAQHLISQGADAIVVACNTATAAAVQILRQTWPSLPVVGVEPGIKPAVQASRNGRIGVMATPGTLASDKFQRLMQTQPDDVEIILQACPGLAALIERGDFDSVEIRHAVQKFCSPFMLARVDTVVLGCTHYAFIRTVIEHELGPSVITLDTAEAVARHAARLVAAIDSAQCGDVRHGESLRIETTGDPDAIRHAVSMMCGESTEVHSVSLDTPSLISDLPSS